MSSIQDYQGLPSTLCTGCGHDSVTQHIIKAFFEAGIDPTTVAKLSGIGCSSKTTAYFMSTAHGFNSIHGRMAAVATGAKIANRNLCIVGISGDGDTANIGLGGFIHLIRRNVPMIYIVENNGVYGLTKGQFSATADADELPSIDICKLAIESGCEFVARGFSGDGKQLVPIIKEAILHPGTAVIDVVSPCVAYANYDGSTKSYNYIKQHNEKTEPQNRESALQALEESHQQGQILTGLLYRAPQRKSLLENLQLPQTPLRDFNRADLAPSRDTFARWMARFR